ncbi:hypothetical protein ACWJJH_11445 [Endozoicomonadaceae bacterium StTr2]
MPLEPRLSNSGPVGGIQPGQSGSSPESVGSGDTGKFGTHVVEARDGESNIPTSTETRDTKSLSEYSVTDTTDDQPGEIRRSFSKGGSLLKEAGKELGGAAWSKLGAGASAIRRGAGKLAGGAAFVAGGIGKGVVFLGKGAGKGIKAAGKAVGNRFSGLAGKVKSGAVKIRKIKVPRPKLPSRPKGLKLPGKALQDRKVVKLLAQRPEQELQSKKLELTERQKDSELAVGSAKDSKQQLETALDLLKHPDRYAFDNGEDVHILLGNGEELTITGEANTPERLKSFQQVQEAVHAQKAEIKQELEATRSDLKRAKKTSKGLEKKAAVVDRAMTRKAVKQEKMTQELKKRQLKSEVSRLKDELESAGEEKKAAKKRAKEAVDNWQTDLKGTSTELKQEIARLEEKLNDTVKANDQAEQIRSDNIARLKKEITTIEKKAEKNPALKAAIGEELTLKQQELKTAQARDLEKRQAAEAQEQELANQLEELDDELAGNKKLRGKEARNTQRDTSEVQDARTRKSELKDQLQQARSDLKSQQKAGKKAIQNIRKGKTE